MKSIFFILGLAVSINGFSQTVSNKLNFQKGQKLEVITQMNRNSQSEFMGQSMNTGMTSSFVSTFEVNDVTGAGATIEGKTKRIKVDITSPMQNMNFDSDNESDLKGQMGKMMEKPLKTKFTMVVDATGKVTSVLEEKEKNKTSQDDAGMLGMMMGGTNMNTGIPKVGDPSIFKVLPEKDLKVGESWVNESKDEGGTMKTTYTLSGVTDSEIQIDFIDESTLTTKQNMMGQDANLEVKAKSNGKIILNKATGLLKQKTMVTESEEEIKVAGQSIPSKTKMTTTLTVK